MVDDNQPGIDESSSSENQSDNTAPGDDWGEDWESAFQAEEFLFSDDDQKSDGAEQAGNTGYDFSPSDTSNFGDLPDFDSDGQPLEKDEDDLEETTEKADTEPGIFSKLKERAATLPTTVWLAITGTLALLFIGTLLFLVLAPGQEPTIQYVQAPETKIIPPKTEAQTAEVMVEVKPPIPPAAPQEIPPQNEKIRQKWHFEPFFIATTDKESGNTTFVSIKLTLITLIDQGAELPQNQKPFIRDMIFQFFANRPFYELRRYSLARGEMNRKLLEWIRREWPQGDVSAIIIQRYKLG